MNRSLKQIDESTKVHKELKKLFVNNRNYDEILFIEDSNVLEDSVRNVRTWLIENKIRHNVLYCIGDVNIEYLENLIDRVHTIVFQTTGTTEIAKHLKNFISKIKDKKKIVECYTHKPVFTRIPKDVVHDLYLIDAFGDDMNEWLMTKLTKNKSY